MDIHKQIDAKVYRQWQENDDNIVRDVVRYAPSTKAKLDLVSKLLDTAITGVFDTEYPTQVCCRALCDNNIPFSSRINFSELFEEALVNDKEHEIFEEFVLVTQPSRHRPRVAESSRKPRSRTHEYYVTVFTGSTSVKTKVCMTFFMRILGISKKYLRRMLDY